MSNGWETLVMEGGREWGAGGERSQFTGWVWYRLAVDQSWFFLYKTHSMEICRPALIVGDSSILHIFLSNFIHVYLLMSGIPAAPPTTDYQPQDGLGAFPLVHGSAKGRTRVWKLCRKVESFRLHPPIFLAWLVKRHHSPRSRNGIASQNLCNWKTDTSPYSAIVLESSVNDLATSDIETSTTIPSGLVGSR